MSIVITQSRRMTDSKYLVLSNYQWLLMILNKTKNIKKNVTGQKRFINNITIINSLEVSLFDGVDRSSGPGGVCWGSQVEASSSSPTNSDTHLDRGLPWVPNSYLDTHIIKGGGVIFLGEKIST